LSLLFVFSSGWREEGSGSTRLPFPLIKVNSSSVADAPTDPYASGIASPSLQDESSSYSQSLSPSRAHQYPVSSLVDLPTPRAARQPKPNSSSSNRPYSRSPGSSSLSSSKAPSDVSDDDILSRSGRSPSPVKRETGLGSSMSGKGGKGMGRSGRMSVAGGEIGREIGGLGRGHTTLSLREQEKARPSIFSMPETLFLMRADSRSTILFLFDSSSTNVIARSSTSR
jgi:hypothetical protein